MSILNFCFPSTMDTYSLWNIACRMSGQNISDKHPSNDTRDNLLLLIQAVGLRDTKLAATLKEGASIEAIVNNIKELLEAGDDPDWNEFKKIFVKKDDWDNFKHSTKSAQAQRKNLITETLDKKYEKLCLLAAAWANIEYVECYPQFRGEEKCRKEKNDMEGWLSRKVKKGDILARNEDGSIKQMQDNDSVTGSEYVAVADVWEIWRNEGCLQQPYYQKYEPTVRPDSSGNGRDRAPVLQAPELHNEQPEPNTSPTPPVSSSTLTPLQGSEDAGNGGRVDGGKPTRMTAERLKPIWQKLANQYAATHKEEKKHGIFKKEDAAKLIINNSEHHGQSLPSVLRAIRKQW